MFLASLLLQSASAACETPKVGVDVSESIESVETALATGDGMVFSKAIGGLTSTLECLDDALPSDVIARLYRIRGLESYVSGRNDAAARWFSAARRLDPAATLPIYPAVHEIHTIYKERDPAKTPMVTLPKPKQPFMVDGVVTRDFPTDLPTVVQLKQGNHWSFDIVEPGARPSYARKRPMRTGLALAAGASAVAAVSMWGVSSSARGSFNDPGQSVDDLKAIQARANTTGLLAITFGAISAGTATGAVLTSR